jgi:hypothetical protein
MPFVGSVVLSLSVSVVVGQTGPRLPLRLPVKQEAAKRVAPDGKAAAASLGQPAEATAKEPDRLQRLRQIQFDRRPSTILKAWSTPAAPPKTTEPTTDDTDKPKEDPKEVAARNALEAEIAALQRQVTLGHWADVKKYLAGLPKTEGKAAYQHLLQSLNRAAGSPQGPSPDMPMPPMAMQPGMPQRERNAFAIDDVLGLAAAAPHPVEKEQINQLGGILRQALDGGSELSVVLNRLERELERPASDAAVSRRQCSQLLLAAGRALEAGRFLPGLDEARSKNDHEALNLLARYFVARHDKEKKAALLEDAWVATQSALLVTGAPEAERNESLSRAVELAPRIRAELGLKWLEESFTQRPERGMEIIATIGSIASRGMETQPANSEFRLKTLQLQKTAIEALLATAPDKAAGWRSSLNLLAANWLREAEFSNQYDRSTSLGPMLRRDPYGNLFYYDEEEYMRMPNQGNRPQAIAAGKVLDVRPNESWIQLVDEALGPRLTIVFAKLYLKVHEEAKAFPYIERLARTQPDRARELVDEFLQVWARNHDPNENRNRTRSYFFIFGFERRAESIPLTRSKQERNLTELADWVKRLRALPDIEINEELLAKAFTTSHSSAEVYKLESIEKVFGPIDRLKPKTLAQLAQQMRGNLAGLWRQPSVQEDKKTKRKQKDIQAEVMRGYGVARSVVEEALQKFPDQWALQTARAALQHDENNYQQELAKSSEFTPRRHAALAEFQKAAQLYAAQVGKLSEDEESSEAYEQWFYAGLGAVDLQGIDSEKLPEPRQPSLIRAAIQALPGPAAERHMAKFANALFTRLSAVGPAVKFRYLRAGFEIVGDHKQAVEARKVFDYYKDLVTEIRLEARIDGPDAVGYERPFGVFVNLRHTREIERESGGFGRYLQNQQNQPYAYNYGRPLENYRDKFTDFVRAAAGEHFDVLSVTFQDEKVNSKATQEYGWRVTPYAYLLLKARGPQVDKLPSMKLDLDFLDTSGYVILPIESPAVPLDAAGSGQPRPMRDLKLTQTLDERQAAEGKLIVEVKATAQGLVPDLNDIVEFHPAGFEIASTDDQGVSVSRFDPESSDTVVVSERTWLVTLRARADLPERPATFRFGTPKVETSASVHQRYVDADVKTVDQVVSLEQAYGERRRRWPSVVGVAAVAAVGSVWLLRRALRRRPTGVLARGYQVPEPLTPFTLLGLLRDIQDHNGLSDGGKHELAESIARIERFYFGKDAGDAEPNLRAIAHEWVQKSKA